MAARQVEVHGGSVASLEVPAAASLQQIRSKVAKACSVQPSYVSLSVDGRRAKDLTQVPAPEHKVAAAVRTSESQEHVVQDTKEVSIPPKPIIMHQDMEGLNVVVAFDEVIDNSIRANARHITYASIDRGGRVTGLVAKDDGDGMPYDLAVNHMRLAHTDSGIVVAPREPNKPLAAGYYHNKNLSRHGKGAAALLYFGSEVETKSKTQDAAETVTVRLNYKDWLEEFKQRGTCTYRVKVTTLFDFTVEDDDSFTSITIGDLQAGIAVKLADPAHRQQWAQQIADHYYFFIKGVPQQLWQTLPDILLLDAPDAARPAGGLTIDIFGIQLSREKPLPREVRPRMELLLDAFIQLMGVHGQHRGQPRLLPFWLPIRWTEPGMAVEQVPDESTIRVDRDDRSGPAGKVRGVHRDFLLLLLYYPYNDGQRTKPELIGDAGVEDVLFTAWCGRMIPKAFLPSLPPLVAVARQASNAAACEWMLTETRLCAFLFCSPEVYTSNHKTELLDDAFEAVTKRLGAKQGRGDTRDDLWVWDTGVNKWCPSPAAAALLAEHHKTHWAPLEKQGELLETYIIDGGVVCGKAFKLPGASTVIKAGDLVQLLTPEEGQDDAGNEAGSSRGRRGGAQSGKGANTSDHPWPMGYRVVEHFRLNPQESVRYSVQLREWMPSWVPGTGHTEAKPASLIRPVPATQAKQLQQKWESDAPQRLFWWDLSKTRDAKAHDQITQLPGISSAPVLTVAQVPDSLAVCFVNSKGQVADFKRDKKWSSTVHLGADKLSVTWRLMRGDLQAGARVAFNETTSLSGARGSKYTVANKCLIEGLRALVDDTPGHYCLRVQSQCPWADQQLEYKFQVGGHEAHTLEASWSAASTAGGPVPSVRLMEEMPELQVRAKDNTGKVVPLPLHGDAEVKAALKVTVKAADGRQMALARPEPEFILAQDMQLVSVKGLRLKLQELRPQGNAPLQAYVSVRLELPGAEPLVLAEQAAPAVQVLSGPANTLDPADPDFGQPQQNPHTRAALSRGSPLLAIKAFILDAKGNKLDIQGEEFCARVKFQPPLAAEPPSTGARGAEGQAGSASKRKRSTAATAAADAAAAAAKGYDIHVDGNVVELPLGFRWNAPPGAGPVGVTLEVFSGGSVPGGASAQPLLTQQGWYRMQRMHAAVEHEAVDAFDNQLPHRWSVWKGRERFSWSEGVAFVLNTVDFSSTIASADRRVPCSQDAAVPDEVLNRFCEGFEPRQDVLGGQLVNTFITPSGRKVCSKASSDRALVKGKLPFFLADYWNSLLDKPLVYEVVFMVTADEQQTLDNVRLLLCNEDDEHDEDFRGRAQLCLQGSDGSLTPVYSDHTRLDIAGGRLSLPPLRIEPEWLSQQSGGTATLVLLDDEPFDASDPAAAGPSNAQQWQWGIEPQKELGRFYVRLAPAAERLLLMAAGPVFSGMQVELQPAQQTAAGRSRGQPGTVRLVEQQLSGSRGAAGSSRQTTAAAAGAWAAWSCAPAQGRGEPQRLVIDPREASLLDRLRLQLGQPITLHFVAVDYVGCPAVLSKQQRQELRRRSLLLLPANGTPVDVDQVDWRWGDATGSAAAVGHLGGPFVNSCTFTATRGCGEAMLSLRLSGSFGRETLLEVPVLLEAGPVAADGVQLAGARVQQHGAVAATALACKQETQLVSLSSWELLEVPAELQVAVKKEPGLEAEPQQQQHAAGGRQQSGRQQQPAQQPAQGAEGGADDPIDLTLSSDGEDDMEVDSEQHASPRQQWLASLEGQQPALQYVLHAQTGDAQQDAELIEGSVVTLQLQLHDSSGHEIAADKPGQLLLRRLLNWQEVQQQQAQPHWQDLSTAAFRSGAAEIKLQLGVGDSWVGEQRFLLQPTGPRGSELAAALPVLLKTQVAPGPFPGDLCAFNLSPADPAAAGCSSFCRVAAAEALEALCGPIPPQQQQVLLGSLLNLQEPTDQEEEVTLYQASSSTQGAPAVTQEVGFRVLARDGSVLPPENLRPLQVQLEAWVAPDSGSGEAVGTWVPAQPHGADGSGPIAVPPLPVPQEPSGDVQQQLQAKRFELPLSCRQLPQAAGWYRFTVGYDTGLPSRDRPLQLQVGPVLLLPGTPHRLLRVAEPQSEVQGSKGRPVSGQKRGRGRAGAAAAAAAGAGNQHAAAPPTDKFVVLDSLAQEQTSEHALQLLDCWGNACKPAAVSLAARLVASGAAKGAQPEPSQEQSQPEQHDEDDAFGGWSREQMALLQQLSMGVLPGQSPGQQQDVQQPPSKRQRSTRGGKQPAAAPGSEAGTSAAAAAAAGGSGSSSGAARHEWQLCLFLKASGTAGAAPSSSRAAAAGAEEGAVKLISALAFDAEGCCLVPALSLQQPPMGITCAGDYSLLAQATPAGEAAASSSFDVHAASLLRLPLGTWHVVSQSTRDLKQRQVTAQRQQRDLEQRVKRAETGAGQLLAALQGLQQRKQQADADVKASQREVNQRQGNLSRPPPVQLQAAAAAAAQQQRLLAGHGAGNRGRQPMLEHPWMVPRPQGGRQGQRGADAPRPCSANEVEGVVSTAMLQLHQRQATVLGPMVTLGSVESHDVAKLLSAYLNSRELHQLIVTSEVAKQQVFSALGQRQDMYSLDLANLVRFYYAPGQPQPLQEQAWYAHHPQRLLLPNSNVRNLLSGVLDWGKYDPDEGFVGFGCNLIHLNPQLLQQRVDVPARQDTQGRLWHDGRNRMNLDLRQTLWHWKLGNVLVFETQQHIEGFRTRLKRNHKNEESLRLIALDGYTFNVRAGSLNHRLDQALDAVGLRFGPAGPDAAANPLDLRLRYIKERQDLLAEAQERHKQQVAAAQRAAKQVQQHREDLQRAEQEVGAAKAEKQQRQQDIAQELENISQQLRQRGG